MGLDAQWCIPVVAIIIVLILMLVFNEQFSDWLNNTKRIILSVFEDGPKGRKQKYVLADDDNVEHLEDGGAPGSGLPSTPKPSFNPLVMPPGQSSETLMALGYVGEVPWGEVIVSTEIDPSIIVNHMDFVKDVRRFSSGANFTSVNDDNTNLAFTNFRGLRRPQNVAIGDSVRQMVDVDENVLQRNKELRW